MSTALATLPANGVGHSIKPMSDIVDVVQHLDELWRLADILVKSRMLPSSIQSTEGAVAIMLKGRELGIGAMAAFAGITVIQGKPVVSPQLMLSLINRSGLMEDMKIVDDGQCCFVTMKRRGRAPHTAAFSDDNARDMQLLNKDNWKKMRPIMRQWRAVAAGARVVFPDVIDGMYTPEEMGADVNEEGEIIDGEIVGSHVPAPEPEPARSATPKGSGLFTNDHVERTREFNEWSTKRCKSTNKAWRIAWYGDEEKGTSGVLTPFLDQGISVPQSIPDVINPHQTKNHLFKWAVDCGLLDPSLADADPKTRQTDALVAKVFFEAREEVEKEMRSYVATQRTLKEAAVYRKHPDIAPPGYFDEPENVEAMETVPAGTDDAFEEGRE